MPISCSIVIVYHSNQTALEKCLNSLKHHAPSFCEVILLNNSCKLISLDFNKSQRMQIINNDYNVGFAQACNQGSRLAIGKYILFLNPDAELTDNFIDVGIRILKNDAIVGIVAPALKGLSGEAQVSAYHFPTVKNLLLESFFLDRILGRRNDFGNAPILNTNDVDQLTVDWVCGAALLMRKYDFISAGGFDQNYFMYFEDVDLCKKMAEMGKRIRYLPGKTIIHNDKMQDDLYNPKFNSQAKILYINKSAVRFWSKHFHNKARIETLLATRALIRMILWGARYFVGGGEDSKERIKGYCSVLCSLAWK